LNIRHLKKYPGKDAEWVRSVLADIIFEWFAWFNDDFSLKEAADARDDILFILIRSPVGGEWSAKSGMEKEDARLQTVS
jgi:hypothetical protein